jgi:hypothetical protein
VPPPEPAIRPRKGAGRRVGATLPLETYVAFKAYVARQGITGEQAIAEAIERLVRDPGGDPSRSRYLGGRRASASHDGRRACSGRTGARPPFRRARHASRSGRLE